MRHAELLPVKTFPDQSLMRIHLSRQRSVIWNRAGVCVCVCVCVTHRERNSWHTSRCRQPKPPTAERRVHHHLYYTSRKHKREKDREAVQRQKTREQEWTDRKYNVKRDKERRGILSQEETMIKWVLTYNGGIFPVGSRPPIICCLQTLLNALLIRPMNPPFTLCLYC